MDILFDLEKIIFILKLNEMKKITIATILIAATQILFAQKNIPAVVKAALAKAYPEATGLKWDKEGKGAFEANFKQKTVPMSLVINAIGEIMETETEIPVYEIPENIITSIHKLYPTAVITGGDVIVSNIGVKKYEVDLTIGKKKTEKQFDMDGNLVK